MSVMVNGLRGGGMLNITYGRLISVPYIRTFRNE
jgi:hypothetical protein